METTKQTGKCWADVSTGGSVIIVGSLAGVSRDGRAMQAAEIRELATAQLNSEGEIEIDDKARVSRGGGGGYVQVWVWVDG